MAKKRTRATTDAGGITDKEPPAKKTNTPIKGSDNVEFNGSAAAAEKANGDVKAKETKVKKPIKKSVPVWATVKSKDGKTTEAPASDMVSVLVQAMKNQMEELESRVVSSISLKKELRRMRPNWPKHLFKMAVEKAIAQDRIKPIKGSYRLIANPKPVPKKTITPAPVKKEKKLDDLLGNIFTWVCEPKEASIILIMKYIEQHHSDLGTGVRFKTAIENGIKKGQLDRINGQGMSGTVQLVDGAKKTGTSYEDAIEDAIIACNEPKDASIRALRHYLSEFHTEFNVSKRPKVLMNSLERCEAKGWVKRISGKGMSGAFRLTVPYRPGPRDLWGEWYEEGTPSGKKMRVSKDLVEESSDQDSFEDSSDEEEEEILPKKKIRGPRKMAQHKPAKKTPTKKITAKKLPVKKAPAKKTPSKRNRKSAGRTK